MKLGSLFSGIGGFDLGFERAGFEVAWQVEFDKHAQGVLRRHWPDTQQFGDVREVGKHNLSAVDVLVGGFPCQDLSVAGRRAGLAGPRSGLFYEFARIIGELEPAWVVIENVPGLLSSRGGRDMGAVLGTLSELGYGWAYRVLDAQYIGVPQRRKRVFIVGHLGTGGRRAAEVLFEPESLRGDSPPSRAPGKEVAGTLGGGASGERGYRNDLDSSGAFVVGSGGVASPLTASAGHHGHSSPRGDGSDNLVYAMTTEQTPKFAENVALTLTKQSPSGGGQTQAVFAIQDGREIEKRQNGLGISADGVAYTIDGTGAQSVGYVPEITGALSDGAHHGGGLNGQDAYTGRVCAPLGLVRRLIPKECERLQGFPDDHTAGQADSHRYRQIGNAVAVPVANWIARRIQDNA